MTISVSRCSFRLLSFSATPLKPWRASILENQSNFNLSPSSDVSWRLCDTWGLSAILQQYFSIWLRFSLNVFHNFPWNREGTHFISGQKKRDIFRNKNECEKASMTGWRANESREYFIEAAFEYNNSMKFDAFRTCCGHKTTQIQKLQTKSSNDFSTTSTTNHWYHRNAN